MHRSGVLALCFLALFALSSGAEITPIRPRDVNQLVFRRGEFAAGLRSTGILQMRRTDHADIPDDSYAIECRNKGTDQRGEVAWECSARGLHPNVALADARITWEGYPNKDSETVLPGSAACEYRLRLQGTHPGLLPLQYTPPTEEERPLIVRVCSMFLTIVGAAMLALFFGVLLIGFCCVQRSVSDPPSKKDDDFHVAPKRIESPAVPYDRLPQKSADAGSGALAAAAAGAAVGAVAAYSLRSRDRPTAVPPRPKSPLATSSVLAENGRNR